MTEFSRRLVSFIRANADMSIYKNGLLVAILVTVINAPVAATADCAMLFKNSQLFEAERVELSHELDRVKALKPQPEKDPALCRASLRFLKDVPYIVISAEPKCFPDEKQAETYKTNVENLAKDAATVAGVFCSDEEERRGVKSKVLDGEP